MIFLSFCQVQESKNTMRRKLLIKVSLWQNLSIRYLSHSFFKILHIGMDIIISPINRKTRTKNKIYIRSTIVLFSIFSKYLFSRFPVKVKTARNIIPIPLLISFSSFSLSSFKSIYQPPKVKR